MTENKSIHSMRLSDPWFEFVKSGNKIFEGRRNWAKTQCILPGDTIEFRHASNEHAPVLRVHVIGIIVFPTFRDALTVLGTEHVLPNDSVQPYTIDQGVEIYKKYVSLETQESDGVLMISMALFKI